MKTDKDGNLLWEKIIHENARGGGFCVQETADKNYISCGFIEDEIAGDRDIFVIKLDGEGEIIWEKRLGGPNSDDGTRIRQTSDGGYILLGYSNISDIDDQIYLAKLDSVGNIEWEKMFGEEIIDKGMWVMESHDGSFVFCGQHIISGANGFELHSFLTKVDSSGNIIWDKNYDKPQDIAASFTATSDGGYAIVGSIDETKVYLLKTDEDGNELWNKTFSNHSEMSCTSIEELSDTSLVFSGFAWRSNFDLDAWVMKTDSLGNMLWDKVFGGEKTEVIWNGTSTRDGGYVICGETTSSGPGQKFYLAKLRGPATEFIRGDSNQDMTLDISDGVHSLAYLFSGGVVINCLDSADTNDDGEIDISDPIFVLTYLFSGGVSIPAPFPDMGIDETEDAIDCAQYSSS